MSKSFILLGRLRRDLMLLNSGEDLQELKTEGELACGQGRAAEVFILQVEAAYSESTHAWGNVDAGAGSMEKPSSLPALNPDNGEQESLDVPKGIEFESVVGNRQKAAEEQLASGDMVDTGQPDKENRQRKGLTSSFDEAQKEAAANKSAETKADDKS